MTIAAPYPFEEVLVNAAVNDTLLVCHQCRGDRHKRQDCPACLGVGYIRACGRCFVVTRSGRENCGPCIVCGGLHYTAGEFPEREEAFHARPPLTPRTISAARA